MTSVPARQPSLNQGDAAGAGTDSAENGARSSVVPSLYKLFLPPTKLTPMMLRSIFQCRLLRVGVAIMVML